MIARNFILAPAVSKFAFQRMSMNVRKIAYSGTTLENYLICAYLQDGQVYFQKGREPRHTTGAFWPVPKIESAAHWAINRAVELGHTPLIIECDIGDRPFEPIKQDEEVPVQYVWLPRKNVGIKYLEEIIWETFSDQMIPDPERYFEKHDPVEVLGVTEKSNCC